MTIENPLDDILAATDGRFPAKYPTASPADLGLNTIDGLDIDLGGLDLDSSDSANPPMLIVNPISGQEIVATDTEQIVRQLYEFQTLKDAVYHFERELKKAARALTVNGTTKTRRLTAMVDGEMRTIVVSEADDFWPMDQLARLHAWCVSEENASELKAFADRFIRAKPKTEFTPVKREYKKLANESFPDGSKLAEAKRRYMECNKGHDHLLPSVKLEGTEQPPKYLEGDE